MEEQKQISSLEEMYENPFDDQKFMMLDDEDFNKEVNNLIEWCEDLDFDKYVSNWHVMATSAHADAPQNLVGTAFMGDFLGDSEEHKGDASLDDQYQYAFN
mmetsp:Transcript_22236/g.21475  ORF Transcript_22236/g.21475 Transcript_22236/m.21475 type:complete len:101 (-) Transcript_22236:154-456(-)